MRHPGRVNAVVRLMTDGCTNFRRFLVEGGQVPAVALTAYTRAEDRVQALQSGYQTHVPKPVEPAELEVVVATLARNFNRRD